MTSTPLDKYQIVDDQEEETPSDDQSSSSSFSSNECPFTAEISSKVSAAFARATGIDLEFAVQLLQDHGWNIDQALQATYEAKEQVQSIIETKTDWKESSERFLKVLSWNTDTTDSEEMELNDSIEQRTETMIEILRREKPDVILLQQVGTVALTLIITCLSSLYDDESVQIDSPDNCNYVSIFTKKSTIGKKNVTRIRNSTNWNMLKVEVEYKNSIHLDLFNAVIDEQTSAFAIEQVNQMDPEHSILFGVSSNVSDSNCFSQASNLDDVWDVTGQKPEATYTFDPELNSNIHGNNKPQRCDRLYFRSSAAAMNHTLKPLHMELEGIEHIKASDIIFPSTHWAIQGYFDI